VEEIVDQEESVPLAQGSPDHFHGILAHIMLPVFLTTSTSFFTSFYLSRKQLSE